MKSKDLLLGILVTMIWGVNFSVIKLGLESLNPFLLAACRFFLSAIPLVFFIKRPAVPLRILTFYGLLFGVGLWGVVNLAIYAGLSAGLASLVLQFSPFMTVIAGGFYFKEKLYTSTFIGILCAALGLLCIIWLTTGMVSIVGLILVLFAAFCWSISNLLVKKHQPKPMFAFIVWSSLFSPILLLVLAWLVNGNTPFENLGQSFDSLAIFSIVFQVYITTVFGYWTWNSLMSKYPVSQVAPLSLLVPIFGLLASHLIFGEHVGVGKVLGAGLIVVGLILLTFAPRLNNAAKRFAAAFR